MGEEAQEGYSSMERKKSQLVWAKAHFFTVHVTVLAGCKHVKLTFQTSTAQLDEQDESYRLPQH